MYVREDSGAEWTHFCAKLHGNSQPILPMQISPAFPVCRSFRAHRTLPHSQKIRVCCWTVQDIQVVQHSTGPWQGSSGGGADCTPTDKNHIQDSSLLIFSDLLTWHNFFHSRQVAVDHAVLFDKKPARGGGRTMDQRVIPDLGTHPYGTLPSTRKDPLVRCYQITGRDFGCGWYICLPHSQPSHAPSARIPLHAQQTQPNSPATLPLRKGISLSMP